MQNIGELSHFDKHGKAQMVDVTEKDATARIAVASGRILMLPATLEKIKSGTIGKGDVLGVAQVAAIMAAKRTWELIPMCHQLLLSGINARFAIDDSNNAIEVSVSVKNTGQTGVEMEALTAVSVALLTIYDMCKAIDKGMVIENILLLSKEGGKSGNYRKEDV